MIIKKVVAILSILLILQVLCFSVFAANRYNQQIIEPLAIRNNGINNFPESYKILLQKLVNQTGHKNWKFKALYTDIDWNELVENESIHMKNTIIKKKTSPYANSWYCSCNQEGDKNYYCASREIIKYYLDPRNFLTEITIFEFLDLSNSTSISVSQIEKLVSGTFLDGETNGKRYAQLIKEASNASGESAYSIVIKIFQELGRRGKGDMPHVVSGKDPDYPNVYNFYNYGAKDGDDNIKAALQYAQNHGWTSQEKALIEGAKLSASSYLKQGQNTKYTYKFDVIGTNISELYKHQYMTNVQDPTSQASMLYNAYKNNGFLNSELTFIIPVYKNMPEYVKLPSTQTGNLYYVSPDSGSVYLRSGPGGTGSGYQSIALIPKDTLINVLQTGINGWAKVQCNGMTGYMSEEFITKVNNKKDVYKLPSVSELPFFDVDADSWYYEAVKYNYGKKIILGNNETTFDPEGRLTRGQLVTILHRMEENPYVAGKSKFPDVQNTNEYYYVAVKWASQTGIVNGYNNGKFAPNDPVTREQFATILRSYSIYKKKYKVQANILNKYSDSGKISDWAKVGMQWATGAGVINGSNGKLNPTGTASRAEVAAMLYNYCTRVK